MNIKWKYDVACEMIADNQPYKNIASKLGYKSLSAVSMLLKRFGGKRMVRIDCYVNDILYKSFYKPDIRFEWNILGAIKRDEYISKTIENIKKSIMILEGREYKFYLVYEITITNEND